MKKITFLISLIMFGGCAFGKTCIFENPNFSLKLEFADNIIIKDARLLGNDGIEINADKLSKTFSGYLNLYGVFTLNVNYRQKATLKDQSFSISLFLQPGETKILFKKDPYQFTVSGASRESFEKFKEIVAKDQVAFEKIRESQSQMDAAVKKNSKTLIAKFQQRVVDMENERKNIYLDFIKHNPGSILSLYAVNMYGSVNIKNPLEVEKAIHLLDEPLQKTEQVITLQQEVDVNKKIMVGQHAPEISQVDTSGRIINLGDLKGQYVLIDFWASWCKPCRAQNPFLVSLYNKFKDKDFTILGVSLDSYKGSWIKAITDDHLEWLQISDLKGWKNEAASLYNIFSVPQNYLLDKDGIIIAKNLNEKDLLKKLDQVIYHKQ